MRAFSPTLISEFDAINERERGCSKESKRSNNKKILNQFNSQRNLVSPFLAQGKRKLNPNPKTNNEFTRRMKSPLPNKKMLPLIHRNTQNKTIIVQRKNIQSRNNTKNQGNTTIYPVKGIRAPSRN